MIRLIKFLFTGDFHLHKWELVEACENYMKSFDSESRRRLGRNYYCKCINCGKYKVFSCIP